MVIDDFGAVTEVALQMNGHVLHLGWLQGVVPGGGDCVCVFSFALTRMSRRFWSLLYATRGGEQKVLAMSGWDCSRCQLERRIFLTGITVGRYGRVRMGLSSGKLSGLDLSVSARLV